MSAPERRTKGRTRPGRLRAIDAYVAHVCEGEDEPEHAEGSRPLNANALRPASPAQNDLRSSPPGDTRSSGPEPSVRGGSSLLIDVGFGIDPVTTVETSEALPRWTIVGVDVDAEAVARANSQKRGNARFIHGGPEEARAFAPAGVIRAMNVLRGYREEDVPRFHGAWAELLENGGLLIEGSTDTDGHVAVAHLIRRRGSEVVREALLFWTDFSRGFAPILFRDWLPRDLRRRVAPGEAIHAFFARWTSAWSSLAERDEPARAFRDSVKALRDGGEPLDDDPWLAENGYSVWRPSTGVPLPSAR